MNVTGWIIAAAAACLGAGLGAWLVRRATASRLDGITDAVTKLGEGVPDTHVLDGGSPKVAALAAAVNVSGARLGRQIQRAQSEQDVRDLIFSSMQEGVLLIGGDGRVVFANDALVRHLGTRPASIWNLLPLSLRQAVDEVSRVRSPISVEVEVGAPTRWLRGTAVPSTEGSSVLLVVRDVTEAKRLEAIRRDFVANASHELKTPAASIQATAETILRASVDDPAVLPRFAEQLDREAIRLSRIVADLLDLSRLEAGSDLGELVRIDTLVREEVARFEERARDADISLEVDTQNVRAMHGSARDVALLARNLIDNAIRYTRPGGRVQVMVEGSPDGHISLRVSDTGIGIPSGDLPRVFERFYRVDQARSRETGGTGLGLAIVKHVAENHGGTLSVDSELGRGTRFEIRLPAANALETGAEGRGDGSDILPG
jgi:two-component system phosphate regulon sensor histidine kinase PhoR